MGIIGPLAGWGAIAAGTAAMGVGVITMATVAPKPTTGDLDDAATAMIFGGVAAIGGPVASVMLGPAELGKLGMGAGASRSLILGAALVGAVAGGIGGAWLGRKV